MRGFTTNTSENIGCNLSSTNALVLSVNWPSEPPMQYSPSTLEPAPAPTTPAHRASVSPLTFKALWTSICSRGGQLAELLGGEKDELAKVDFEVTRLNDAQTSSTAALMEQSQSSLAAERLRETAREERIVRGWSSVLAGLPDEKREKVQPP